MKEPVARLAADVRAEQLVRAVRTMPVRGVEIGVYRGAMSSRVLNLDHSIMLYLVDPWRPMEWRESYKDTEDFHHTMTQADHDAAMAEALRAVDYHKHRVTVIRETSAKASEMFEDGSLDFVFIDGDHSYEGCKQDIALWWPKLRPGGLLSGHDYRDDKNFGVKQAVHEWLGDKQLQVGGNYTWFVWKPWA